MTGYTNLALRNVSRLQAGQYTCTASNVEGDGKSKELHLQIVCELIFLIILLYCTYYFCFGQICISMWIHSSIHWLIFYNIFWIITIKTIYFWAWKISQKVFIKKIDWSIYDYFLKKLKYMNILDKIKHKIFKFEVIESLQGK